jgi:hypothetical protein
MFTENTAASISRFAIVICKVESTDVSPPTADAGCEVVLPSFIWVQQVGFPYADRAPGDLLPTLLAPTAVTLLREVAPLFDIIVVVAGFVGTETASFSRVRGSMGWGGVRGCIHVIGRLDDTWLGDWGQRFSRGLGGRGVGGGG